MNDMLYGRLENLKFASAAKYLDGEPEYTRDIVNALARVFGDVGCDLIGGDMGIIVSAACDRLCILKAKAEMSAQLNRMKDVDIDKNNEADFAVRSDSLLTAVDDLLKINEEKGLCDEPGEYWDDGDGYIDSNSPSASDKLKSAIARLIELRDTANVMISIKTHINPTQQQDKANQ